MKKLGSLFANSTSQIIALALVTIAVISLAGNFTTAVSVKESQSDAMDVNRTGLQRTLSQRVLLLAQVHRLEGDERSLRMLDQAIASFEQNQSELLVAASSDGTALLDPKALARLIEISPEIERYLLNVRVAALSSNKVLPSIDDSGRILGLLDEVVALEESASRHRLERILSQGIMFSILSVLVTIVLGFLVLRYRISKDHKEKLSLHKLSRKFIDVFEGSPVIQYVLDESYCIVDLNAAGEQAFGYLRQNIIGKSILEFVSERDRLELQKMNAEQNLFDKNEARFSVKFVRRTGTLLPARLYVSRSVASVGNGTVYNVIAIDQREAVEARARADRILKRYEDSLRFSPLPLFSAVESGEIVRANPAFLGLCKATSMEQLSDLGFNHLVSVAAKRLLRPNAPQTIVNKQTLFDVEGGARDVILSMRLSGDGGDSASYIEGALSDITELEVIKREVQASRARFRSLYDETPVMQCSLNRQFNISDTNLFLCTRLNSTYHDLRGRAFTDLLTEESSSTLVVQLDRAVECGNTLTTEVDVKNPDGTTFPTRIFARPVHARGGPLQKVFVTLLDLSDLAEAEQERDEIAEKLRTAEKLEAVGQLAAGIAHEINTPCQYVNDNLRFLNEAFEEILPLLGQPGIQQSKGDVDLEFYHEELPSAISQSIEGMTQITKIVRAMKDFSHPGTDSKENVDLNRLVESVTTVARNEWKYIANLELNLDPSVGQVPCAGSAINQVVLNMVVNAAHAMESKFVNGEMGQIKIQTRRRSDQIEMTIEDNGGGIPNDLLNQIYNPFFTTKEVGKGTGQGLAIAHRIVTEEHGGSLEVESTVGEGTRFTIGLPLSPMENAA